MAKAPDLKIVTVEELNRAPAMFNGKTIFVDAQVSGSVSHQFKGRVCLTVHGKTTTIVGDKANKDGVSFTIFDDKAFLTNAWVPDVLYFVRLTVSVVKAPGGSWLARVNDIHEIGKGTPVKSDSKTLPAALSEKAEQQDVKSPLLPSAAVVTVDDLNKHPVKYQGQTIQVIGQLSGTTVASDTQRLRLNVKGEKVFIDASKMQDGINFILTKSRQTLLAGFTGSFSQAKITVRVNQGLRGNWLATVQAIEKTAP